jgi:Galactose oxidase, central domain
MALDPIRSSRVDVGRRRDQLGESMASETRRPAAHRIVVVALAAIVVGDCGTSADPARTAPSPSGAPAASGAPVASGGAGAGWQPGPDAPLALTEVAAAALDGVIWIAGGLTADGKASDRTFALDVASGTWSETPALPEPVHHAALVSDGESLWLLGGYVGDGFDRPTDAVRTLAPATGAAAWTDAPPLPEPRAAGAAAWDGSRLVYGGGVGPGVLSELVFAGGPDGFEPIARLSEPREHLAATSDGEGRTWFLGGRNGGLEGNLGRVDVVEDNEVNAAGDLPTPRGGVAAFHWPAVGACLVGGESPDGTNRQVECIAADGTITALPDLAAPRHGLGAAVVDGMAYSLLGGPEPGLFASPTVETMTLP